ncbi:hypothetical protein BDY17DRAFT_4782 [Neohortaea acidophila]|uniref:RING-type domain-containing protein n=1 Tax=Neohortaea acidophila TaxID=245834 RepID=A0A6A6Q524_9PEZI|nr:uncharacterized protein BDY17DRAFT_4782 [Neohortaea acidophila]KAF2487171.1 hypothetical protein BDY17DRAFT_4782 [Neohortaea acidophila]
MATTCAKCHEALEVEIGPDEDEDVEMEASSSGNNTQTIPDDVHLPCGCHFHWQCLLDSYELSKCPHCSTEIVSSPPSTSQQQIIVNLTNEGGYQEHIDIFPLLQEESYLRAYPEERKCRAFLEFCREGDHQAIVDLLHSCSEPAGEDDDDLDIDEMKDADADLPNKTPDEILRYQDPIGDMQSGLHAAAANGHREVAWLLLLLASQLPESEFPALVYQEAAALGIMREQQEGKVDIRSLKDSFGQSAEDIAKEYGVVWNGWIGNGRLAIR